MTSNQLTSSIPTPFSDESERDRRRSRRTGSGRLGRGAICGRTVSKVVHSSSRSLRESRRSIHPSILPSAHLYLRASSSQCTVFLGRAVCRRTAVDVTLLTRIDKWIYRRSTTSVAAAEDEVEEDEAEAALNGARAVYIRG